MTAPQGPAVQETAPQGTGPHPAPHGAADWLVAPELAPDAADPVLAPLYEAAARGALALPFCAACATPLELEQYVCDGCGASAETGTAGRQWRDVPLACAVHAATLVHRHEPGLIVATGPYPVIDVELASGHRLVPTTAAPSGQAPDVGAPVEITFRTVGGVTLPAVRFPVAASPAGSYRQETDVMTVTDQAGSPAEAAAGLRPGDVRALVQPDRVRGLVYSDPQVYDLETRRIFREGWVFVAHESEVPQPGDYVTKRIAGEPYVVARGKDGEVRVMANRCTHRGNRLCNADKGNSSSFRCPYHGWTFSNDGSLSGVPMRDGYAERFGEVRASLGLVQAPRQESYGGFVFASLAPEGITLAEHLGNARHAIDRLVALSPTGSIQLSAGWMKHRMYQRRLLIESPELLGDAVEEMLRVVSPVLAFCRTATADTEIRGQRIAVGDYVALLYASANRDEEIWPDPDRFDVLRRQARPHVAFGFGAHVCLGANLARMEARVLFGELLRAFPDFQVTEPAVRGQSTLVAIVKQLPAVFGARAHAAAGA